MFGGRKGLAALIAASTSTAALSTVRDSSNCTVSWATPSALDEVSCVMPGIWLSCCSSGVASDEAMVPGSAPGNCAEIWIVG